MPYRTVHIMISTGSRMRGTRTSGSTSGDWRRSYGVDRGTSIAKATGKQQPPPTSPKPPCQSSTLPLVDTPSQYVKIFSLQRITQALLTCHMVILHQYAVGCQGPVLSNET